ncbi:glycerate kinase family protein [Amedibacillus sp. YH-ame10]
MKVIIACDSYKGCMTSKDVAMQIEDGIHEVDPTIETLSYVIADGGEGTVEAFYETMHGVKQPVNTTDAYGKKIKSEYTIIEDGQTAVIEVANIIGLNMYEREKRTPFFASSYGVGTVLLDAVEKGCKKIIIGLGGSATNDGGMGLLQSLGARFYDMNHKYLSPQAINLEKIRYIDFHRLNDLKDIELIAACDVKNHLLGEEGATYIFGKQKGFFPNQLKKIDQGMENYRFQIQRYTNIDINSFEGGGAAGGIGAVLIGLLHATMHPGIELLLSYSDMEEQIKDCDLLITGEGQSDQQTMFGKVPVGILNMAKKHEKPCVCISGALGIGYQNLYDLGFIGIYSIADRAMTFQQALANAPEKLKNATYAIMKTILYYAK